MADEFVLRVPGLRQADKITLEEHLPEGAVRFEPQEKPAGAYGEIALAIALIALSAPALRGWIAYLKARHGEDEFEEVVEIDRPDGTHVKRRIRRKQGQAISDAVATELAEVPELKVALSALAPS